MVSKTLSVADQLVETREFSRFSKNRNVCCLVTLRRILNFGFWILGSESILDRRTGFAGGWIAAQILDEQRMTDHFNES